MATLTIIKDSYLGPTPIRKRPITPQEKIMPLLKNEQDRIFTYKDYLTWNDNEGWELIDGVAYSMAPSPSVNHQRVAMELGRQFANFLSDKPCEVFSAPFDVRLPETNEDDEDSKNVVQPDIVVICDSSKLDEKGCKGVPDLTIEIVSPASASIDNIKKMDYPHMLITTSLSDNRVLFDEPAKFTAKLREYKTDNNLLLLKTEMNAGHGGKSGRDGAIEEIALDYAFALKISKKI